MTGKLDLGDGHWLTFTQWKPDRSIPENAERYKNVPDADPIGGILAHTKADGSLCEGSIWFDVPAVHQVFPERHVWQVECWEPLTLSPSFLCHCGDHGFIKQGKWVRA